MRRNSDSLARQVRSGRGILLSASGHRPHVEELGREMICLHTYGERFTINGQIPREAARIDKVIPDTPDRYPEVFSYDEKPRTIKVGEGESHPVSKEVYSYSVSGFEVVKNWLGCRKKTPPRLIAMTLDIYSHLIPDVQEKAAQALEEMLS